MGHRGYLTDEYVRYTNEDLRKAEIPETDFVFLDAEKRDYIEHFKAVFPKLLPRGIVVADNVLSHQEELRNYLEYVRKLPSCNSILLPIERGLELTYKFAKKAKTFEAYNKQQLDKVSTQHGKKKK